MINLPIWVVTGLYAVQSVAYFYSGKPWWGIMLFGYAFANLGLIWSTYQ